MCIIMYPRGDLYSTDCLSLYLFLDALDELHLESRKVAVMTLSILNQKNGKHLTKTSGSTLLSKYQCYWYVRFKQLVSVTWSWLQLILLLWWSQVSGYVDKDGDGLTSLDSRNSRTRREAMLGDRAALWRRISLSLVHPMMVRCLPHGLMER